MSKEFNPREISLILGLGNIGARYRDTYHNVGFFAAEKYATECNATFRKRTTYHALVAEIGRQLVAKPTTMMNRSGMAVRRLMRARNIEPQHLLVLHDDTDVALGTYKLSFERGSAGHHGVESIDAALGTHAFWRARIGIRDKRDFDKGVRTRAGDFVLNRITMKDRARIDAAVQKLIDILLIQPQD